MAGKTPSTVVSRFQRLFRGRETAYGQWKQGDVQTVKKPVTEAEWKAHLAGKGPFLGIIPITETNDCYFGAIDVDDDTVDHASLAALVELAGLPLVVCRSKSGGAHLYLFLRDPAPAKLVVEKLKSWAKALKLKNPPYESGQQHPLEIFPKQTKITPDVTGNWINLPYYGNGTTNRYAVNETGEQLALEDFLTYAESKAISATMLEGLEASGAGGAFEEGPPCLNSLDEVGLSEGTRNQGMFNVGIYYKLKNPDGWEEDLREYNKSGKVDPPLRDVELKALVRSLKTRDYQYRCDDAPINSYCDKGPCKKAKHGIGGFRKQKVAAAVPEMSNLRKVLTDPPRWLLKVDDQDIDLATEDLMLMPRFRKAILERCSRIFPLLKQGEWDDYLSELLKNRTEIEAPEDAGSRGQFRYLLREFLMRRRNARTREDLLAGLPVEEGGKVLFRSPDFISFLERKKFREYEPAQIFTELGRLGAGHTKLNVKGSGFQVWFIETPQDEQVEEFEQLTDETPDF